MDECEYDVKLCRWMNRWIFEMSGIFSFVLEQGVHLHLHRKQWTCNNLIPGAGEPHLVQTILGTVEEGSGEHQGLTKQDQVQNRIEEGEEGSGELGREENVE